MQKSEFQKKYQFTDHEISLISAIITHTSGKIVSIKPTPLRQDGSVVPFADRVTIVAGYRY